MSDPADSGDLAPIVPCDPRAGFVSQRDEVQAAMLRVMDNGRYILGSEVTAFENEFAEYLGVPYAVGVASGTDAIAIALRACGIGVGDLVVTVSHTAVATVAAIESTGALPLLVDIDPATFTMNPDCLHSALEECNRRPDFRGRVKAVVPVHLYGMPAGMERILEIAKQFGLRVIEDCSQAHGAAISGRKVGTFGDLAAFSLYPTKNLGAMGDAGIIATCQPELHDMVSLLRQYGWRSRNVSDVPGLNSRLDELQAAILRVRLKHLDHSNRARATLAESYDTLLRGAMVVLPCRPAAITHAHHQYVVRTTQRDHVRQTLQDYGIQTLIHYNRAVHQQPAYSNRIPVAGSLEHTEAAVETILSLPIYPELPLADASRVASTLRAITYAFGECPR